MDIYTLFAAAERQGYEMPDQRQASLDAIEAHAVKSFPGAKSPDEAVKMLARHQADQIRAAKIRVSEHILSLEQRIEQLEQMK